MQSTPDVAEAARQLEICNACRYCESFCAVFPALERRRSVTNEDVSFLANLCHGCKGCFYACQYAPPHPFAVNLPKTLATVRAETYSEYAWPTPLARLFERNGVVVSIVTAVAIAVVLMATAIVQDNAVLFATHEGPGAFYAIIPKGLMVGIASVTFLYAVLALTMGAVRFWKDAGTAGPSTHPGRAVKAATGDVLMLRNLGGGGHGCNDRDESFSNSRRWLHHAMFYGFALCFASTVSAWIYDTFVGVEAPYPLLSIPVVLGTVGGVLLLIGTIGLLWVKLIADRRPTDTNLLGADSALLLLLALTSLSGLLLLGLRETAAMGLLLALHLGVVLALFLVLPYSKFVHGIYRSCALLKDRLERNGAPIGETG